MLTIIESVGNLCRSGARAGVVVSFLVARDLVTAARLALSRARR
jgi:hypothetical protein